MKKNISIYEAAKAVLGTDKIEISEVGSKYPLLSRTIALINSEYLLDLLAGLNVTAEEAEAGLQGLEEVEQEETKPVKEKAGKKAKKEEPVDEPEEDQEDETEEVEDYESMTSKKLYDLCCKRGISSKCKDRKKATLIALLKENDGAGDEAEEPEEDWDEPETEEVDPYAGKKAKELYDMCKERGLKVKPKQKAEAYVELLKADDAKADEPEEESEDDDDEWEI